jgi:hypothetical protein
MKTIQQFFIQGAAEKMAHAKTKNFSRRSNYEKDVIFVAFVDRLIDLGLLYMIESKNFRSHQ